MMGQQKEEVPPAISAPVQATPTLSPEQNKDKPPGRASKLPQKCPLTKCLLCTREQPYCLVTSLYPKYANYYHLSFFNSHTVLFLFSYLQSYRGSVFNLLRKMDLQWRTLVGFARDAAAGVCLIHS